MNKSKEQWADVDARHFVATESPKLITALIRDAQQDIESLHAEVERMRAALAKIAAWPDGGSKYGQGPIKTFAAMTLEAGR